MFQITIYCSLLNNIAKTVCQLADKSFKNNLRMVILPDYFLISQLDKLLWTYSSKSFLPHATNTDPVPSLQPIYLTDKIENPNQSSILLMVSPINLDVLLLEKNGLKKIFIVFDDLTKIKSFYLQLSEHLEQNKTSNKVDLYIQNSEGLWVKENIKELA